MALWDDLMGQFSGNLGAAPPNDPPAAPPGLLNNPQALPYVPFDRSQSGADYLQSLLPRAAAMALPEGYRAVPTSTYRPGAVAADTGKESMHASGGALDFAVLDPNGRPVSGALGAPDTTGHYRNMALAMRQIADPDLVPWLAWGGNFGRQDPIHVDLGGDYRGARGTLAQMVGRMASR